MMHFVESETTTQRMDGTDANAFTRRVLASRKEGVFDTWMYNSLVLQLASIGPAKKKLNELGRAYIERRIGTTAGPAACAIWVPLPGSVQTLQLVSEAGCGTDIPTFDLA